MDLHNSEHENVVRNEYPAPVNQKQSPELLLTAGTGISSQIGSV
jgi:hypothetical protein